MISLRYPDQTQTFYKQTYSLIHNFPCIFISSWQHNRKNRQPFGTTFECAKCEVEWVCQQWKLFILRLRFIFIVNNQYHNLYLLDQKSRQRRRHNKLHSVDRICYFYWSSIYHISRPLTTIESIRSLYDGRWSEEKKSITVLTPLRSLAL